MPAVPVDISVSSTLSSPLPNPIAPIETPSIYTPDGASGIGVPVIYSSQEDGGVPVSETITSEVEESIDAPTIKTAESQEAIPNPSVITPSQTDAVAPPFPLNHARILYENYLFNYASVTPSSGTNASYSVLPNTWQRWEFTATGTDSILIVLPSNFDIDTICIGAHNLSTAGAEIEALYDVDATAGGFISFADAVTPETNNAIMFHRSSSVSVRRIQINFSGASGDVYIGYISAGIALQMQRPFFSGHDPITDATVTRFYDSWTESGNVIGRQKRSQGQETECNWKNIDDSWYREYFTPFKVSALELPYFIAWNLLEYPNDVGLCYTDGDINSPYSGIRNLRTISLTAKGAL